MSPTPQRLQITAASPDPALLDLPWHIPLEDWPAETLAALPRGISRHIVRFAKMSGRVIAVKEIGETVAYREYELLRQLRRLDVPSVEPVGVITGRSDPDGERLEAVLITKHLSFSLPYRALFSQSLRPDTATRLIDALAVLLVRLHLVGFYWGDVSLSNTLFRRDAETFAAYLVDAETGDLHDKLSRRSARVRPRGRPRQHHRRAHGPAGRRVPRGGRRRRRHRGRPRRAVRRAVARPDRVGVVQLRGPLARAGPHRPPQRPRLRRRRARHHHRRRRHQRPASSRRSSTPGTTPAGSCASPVSTCRRTRRAACSTTSTSTAPPPTGSARTSRSSRTTG